MESNLTHQFPYIDYGFPRHIRITEHNRDRLAYVSDICRELNEYVSSSVMRFIIGDLSIYRDYDDFIAQIHRFGVGEVIEVYQEMYDKWLRAANRSPGAGF